MILRSTSTSTVFLTCVSLVAFAANSVLCRIALGRGLIDAASFSSIRVISGAVVLLLIVAPRWRRQGYRRVDPQAASALFFYMIFFSYAYISLSTGTGALILFGAVQLTMFIVALRAGEEFTFFSWVGLALAALGLIYLVLPGVTAPDPPWRSIHDDRGNRLGMVLTARPRRNRCNWSDREQFSLQHSARHRCESLLFSNGAGFSGRGGISGRVRRPGIRTRLCRLVCCFARADYDPCGNRDAVRAGALQHLAASYFSPRRSPRGSC